MIILDIGCGRKKIVGAVGIDFSPMSDADVILNLNTDSLPFENDSVDFVYSSHTLEHLTSDGFLHVMSEVYRVLKPNGQFKIVVPYFTSNSNLANIFHNNNVCFNEHTFRFFSSEVDCAAIPKADYQTPSCPHWGLRYSANCEINIEFQTIELSYFYFPEYIHLSAEEQTLARNTKLNVVDQIIYSLSAIKPCPIRPETGPTAEAHDPDEHIKKQIKYLNQQIEYIENNVQIDSALLTKAKKMADNMVTLEGGHLYASKAYNAPVTPANQLIYELDYLIQILQKNIDSAVDN